MSPHTLLYLDLELGRDDRFHAMAVRRDGSERVWDGTPFELAHRELCAFIRPNDLLVGHNLHVFDRQKLAQRVPSSPLLRLPTLDTLELSALAHPARPYHRLTKNDQLVRDARPNPLSDVRASEVVLTDAVAALAALPMEEAALLQALLPRTRLEPTARQGWLHLFALLGWTWETDHPLDLRAAWQGRVCRNAPLLDAPPDDLGLVMLAAWLRAAHRNDGSVLPAWVRHSWPQTGARIRELRATRCHDPACDWCRVNLSAEHWLQEVFGFDRFRDEPLAPDGGSLQRLLVERGLVGLPTFGILPTGGGKSLCFQVPAETRHRLLGQLTLVISPLQSLMKDQVDGLQGRIPHARAIYSGLPALLRPQVVEEVRSGACGLLYLSPEQLRNGSVLRLLGQRDLGAVVFDEAHCLSQWGHDFRTDYRYVLKALGAMLEAQGLPMPPVFLFTATTQHDATAEILDHVARHTGTRPDVYDGGSRRDNLTTVVRQVPESGRLDALVALLAEHLGDGDAARGTAIVFCGSRRRTKDVADALGAFGYPAVAYHAGLEADARRELQDAFIGGQHPVITATNAFGMGVDKADVRLVVHMDMPSSLEAYLQEAGRAGRDRLPATTVLFWSPGDAEARFALGATGDLSSDDLDATWRAIQVVPGATVNGVEQRVVTARELLFGEALNGRFDPHDQGEETRVKAAINWLELAHVLERLENHTQVFTGRPLPPSLTTALEQVRALDLPPQKQRQWELVLTELYVRGDDGLSADELAVLCQSMSFREPLDGGLRILSILNQMAEARLVSKGQTFAAFISHGVADSSLRRLERWVGWEEALLAALEEDGLDDTRLVHLVVVADRLSTEDLRCLPDDVARLLGAWATAAQGLSRAQGCARFQHRRGPVGKLVVDVPYTTLRAWLRTRQAIARRALEALVEKTDGAGKQLLIATALEELVARCDGDLVLRSAMEDGNEAVRSAVAWLHDLRIITVQNGLAVFRSAMRIDRRLEWPKPRTAATQPAVIALQRHNLQKVLRVHVMDRWAQLMLDAPDQAEQLRADWFALPVDAFTARWFPRQKQQIERPTTPESYRRIVTDLNDEAQEKIVTRDQRRNHLVLAGPGSGKTRILVHRVAWLLRCQRVRARQILVVCYTRNNALELRRRLQALVGDDGRRVRIRTLHAVAMGMVGGQRLGPGGDLTLESCIPVAAAMLRGEGLDTAQQSQQRDALLRGVNFLFIDEYQDIDADKYALLSAIAGRAMEGDQRKLAVFAVGDDDQAIFAWDGASTDFIRSFEADYQAQRAVITHSYRNPIAVLELAQELIADLPDRLKAAHRLSVDPARTFDPPMGPWAEAHDELGGRIVWRQQGSVRDAAHLLMATVRQWLDAGVEATSIGVLARNRQTGLHRLRIAAERLGVPFTWTLPSDGSVPVARIREVASLFTLLEQEEAETLSAARIERHLADLGMGPWTRALRVWLEPHQGRTLSREEWRYDLISWIRLERRARTLGEGVHLGTMHSAKGLEFDHVLLLDDGTMGDDAGERRLLYVALTRARRSLQLYSGWDPSPTFRALRHPLLAVLPSPGLVADAVQDHDYGLVGREDIWIDWLGLQAADHQGHRALAEAQPGDPFTMRNEGHWTAIVDAQGRTVARLSAKGHSRWATLLQHSLKLRLVAVLCERRDDPAREEEHRAALRVDSWHTGVWEARWQQEEGATSGPWSGWYP